MSNRTKKTPRKIRLFLEALRETGGNISRSAQAVAVCRRTVYQWRKDDGDFAARWDEALDEGIDELEAEARRRALIGVRQKKFTRDGQAIIDPETGKQYEEFVCSDTILMFLLKAHRPDKYKDRTDITSGGEVVKVYAGFDPNRV